jgi:hypothetical protein
MRRERGGLRFFVHVLCVLLLVAPPAARLSLSARSRGAGAAEAGAALAQLEAQVDALEEQLRRAHEDLARLGGAPSSERYRVSLGDVIPVSDPSPRRGALWASLRDPERVARDSAVLWESRLVGRVREVYRAPGLARVATLLDADFRVRFRCGDVSGMLHSTGRSDPRDDHPLLEIRHLSRPGELPEGEPVFTAGDDGIYPPGLRIGVLRRDPTAGTQSGNQLVSADLSGAELTQVQVATDVAAQSLHGLPPGDRR